MIAVCALNLPFFFFFMAAHHTGGRAYFASFSEPELLNFLHF